MAVGVELATAYVSIVPSFRGIKANLTKGIAAAMGGVSADMENTLVKGAEKAATSAGKAASAALDREMRVGTEKTVSGVKSAFSKLGSMTSLNAGGAANMFGSVGNELSAMEAGVGGLTTRFSGLGTSVGNFFRSFKNSSAETEGWGQRLAAGIGKADDAVVSFGANVGGKLKNAFQSILPSASQVGNFALDFAKMSTLAVGAGVAIGGVSLAVAGINRLNTLEKSNIAFETMTGSAEKARAIMADLTKFAKLTPFPLDDIATAGKTLFAMGQSAEKLVPTLKAAGDAAAAIGSGSQGMKDISFIMGQIITKGKLEGDELIQLAERGVNAQAILGNMLGVTATKVGAKVKDMGLSGKDAVDMLVKGIEEGTNGINGQTAKMGGMLERFKTTWEGRWSDMKAAFSRLGATIFEPLFTGGKSAMAEGSKLLDQIAKDWPENMRKLKKALDDAGVSDAFSKLGDALKALGTALEPMVRGFKDLSPAILQGLAFGIKTFADEVQKFANFLKENPGFARAMGIGLLIVAGALLAVGAAMLLVTAVSGAMLLGVLAAIGGIVMGVAAFGQWIYENWGSIWDWVAKTASDAWDLIKQGLALFGIDVDGIFTTIKDLVTGNWSGLWEDIKRLANEATGGLLSDIGNFSISWSDVWKFIEDAGSAAIQGFVWAVSGPIQGLISLFWGAVEAAQSLVSWIGRVNSTPINNASSFTVQVPHFATGGVVTGPTLGLIGEAGPEAVMPLDKLQNFVDTHGGGVQSQAQVVVLDPTGADKAFVEMLRRMVRNEGRGNVQKAFGY